MADASDGKQRSMPCGAVWALRGVRDEILLRLRVRRAVLETEGLGASQPVSNIP